MKKKHVGKRFLAVLLAVLLLFGNAAMEVHGKEAVTTEEVETEVPVEEDVQGTEDTKEHVKEEKKETAEEKEQIYYEWQSLEEILELCEEGLNLQEFFRYTIWDFLTREELEELVEAGETLDDLYARMPAVLSLGEERVAGFSGAVSSSLGEIPALGSGSHGPMLRIHLNGETAFCAKFGAACRTGMVYTSVPLSDIGIDGEEEQILKGLLAQYAEAQSVYTGPVNYIMTQAGIWLVQNGGWSGDAESMARSVEPLFTKTPDCPTVQFAADYFRAIVNWLKLPENAEKIAAVKLEAWANGPNQYLVTATGDTGGSSGGGASGYARVEIRKQDAETGNVIAENASFTIYEWDGSEFVKSSSRMLREGDSYRSDDLFWTTQNQGKFQVVESLAPADGDRTGYYGDFAGSAKRRYEILVEESMQGEAILLTNQGSQFVNQRVTGSIQIYKKDIEADAYLSGENSHGIACLDGAIYDLYAREDIVHPDGVTGILYEKDERVDSGTIRQGICRFENLYLGDYYVKERQKGETLEDGKKLSYAKGYLLDEMIYEVTLPYEGEDKANVHRNVYSDKEQVIKAKAVLEKVESAAGQGNISYLEGAGFTLYRIDRLSKQESFVKREDGTYEESSIWKAYLVENYNQEIPKYDFSGEESAIATVYLRETDMREDTAYYWQDALQDLEAGKLISLGAHRYRVAELFSDVSGQVVTPYLPYGQYLVVETTVPQDHFMAPPFVLTFNEGKTTTVLTTGVTENTPYGKNLLKSAGDLVWSWEAAYFSKIIDNEATEELLKLYKKDADTGKTVLLPDTAFRIAWIEEETGEKTYLTHTTYYPETENREIFRTNAEGCLQLPELLPVGLYQIEEVEGPNGFYNDVPAGYVQFRVTTEREYVSLLGSPEGSTLEGSFGKRDVLLIVEDYKNRETRGELTLRKMGEVLVGYEPKRLLEKVKMFFGQDVEKQFVYEEQPLAGAEYTIRAAEDIVTQDRQMDAHGKRTLWFEKGETVAVVVTGEKGQVEQVKVPTQDYPGGHPIVSVIHDGTLGSVKVYLPLGAYEIEETKAPYGYTRAEEKYWVIFTWEHQFQEFVFNKTEIGETEAGDYDLETGTLQVTNQRVKAVPEEGAEAPGIGIYKKAKENGQPLSGVAFELYTVDNIYSGDGEVLAAAGECLAACITGVDGKGIFAQDVPLRDELYSVEEGRNSGRYEIREVAVPSGILLDSMPIPIEFTYQDDKTEFVVLQGQQENASSEVWISKQDLVSGAELKGASLTVTEEWSGKTVHSWISDGTCREIRGLAVNESAEEPFYTYMLTESLAPEGYLLAESIRFQLVKEAGAEDEVENSIYLYDVRSEQWVKAEDRTVVMKDAPDVQPEETPEDSPKTSRPSSETTKVTAVASGDTQRVGGYLLLGAAALGLFTLGSLAVRFRRQKKHK